MSSRERYVYGHIPDVPFGTKFRSRDELMRAGVHAPSQGGIHGDPRENGGAYSICLSKGYEDNKDEGNTITYVGSGGQDKKSGQQIANQSFDDSGNQALLRSFETGRPVRVVRGPNPASYYAPRSGYRYDGLYIVDSAQMGRGKSGFNMCFFQLRRLIEEGDGPVPTRRLLTGQKMSSMLRKARAPR